MIKSIFDQLEATPKGTEKLAILKANADNETLKKVMVAALDPYTQYYIKKIPKYTRATAGADLNHFLNEIDDLSSRTYTGHAGIDHLTCALESIQSDDAIIAERIIRKDLRCGVSTSTVNKVWKNLIPTYPCLLARPGEEKYLKNISYPAYSQLKADGMRINFICQDGHITSRGRSGKEVNFFGLLDDTFTAFEIEYGEPCVFDGELLVEDECGNIMSRKKGNGIITKAIRGKISAEEAQMIRVQIWDVIPYSEFINNKSKDSYDKRLAKLETLFSSIERTKEELVFDILRGKQQLVHLLETKVVNNYEEARAHFKEMRDLGMEGTIIKNMDHVWEDKRSNGLVKLKAEEDADLEVIGWNQGNIGTKWENHVGSLICASSDRKVEVSISGFSDDLRQEITDNIDEWIGRIVTVKYNERVASKDKNRAGVDSLFLPRFLEKREDKDIANNSDEII